MTPARITYHALNVVVCMAICAGLLATTHHRDWVALTFFICTVFSGVHSMGELRRDKP